MQISLKDLITTIDLSLQQIAEECMSNQPTGSFILMSPKTGAIYALVSHPNFDPTILSKKLFYKGF